MLDKNKHYCFAVAYFFAFSCTTWLALSAL